MKKDVELAVMKYNSEIDEIVSDISGLKITSDVSEIKVKELQMLSDKFAILTSVSRRNKVKKAYELLREEYGIYLQEQVEQLKGSK